MNRILITAAIALTTLGAQAAQPPYHEREKGQQLIQRLSSEQNLDTEWLRSVLADARYQPRIVATMKRPAEKVLEWHQYRKIFIKPDRVEDGVAFIKQHAALFKQVEKAYGVPPSIIAAILGVETRFGRFLGKDRVLDALVTLGFDYPPRADFFFSELEKFLILCASEGISAREAVGSYAGAMGMPQFISSSYLAYAVDFNGNGKRDLWQEPADIIGSVANYFSAHGWLPGAAVAAQALPPASTVPELERSKRKTRYSYAELSAAGVNLAEPPRTDTAVGLVELLGDAGEEYWVGYKNFFVITSYNHSPLYAMAVFQLSQDIETAMAKTLQ